MKELLEKLQQLKLTEMNRQLEAVLGEAARRNLSLVDTLEPERSFPCL